MSRSGPFCQTHGDGFPAGGKQEREGEGQEREGEGQEREGEGQLSSCLLWWPVVLLTVLLSSDAKVVGGRACAPGLKRSGNRNEDTALLTVTPLLPHPLMGVAGEV